MEFNQKQDLSQSFWDKDLNGSSDLSSFHDLEQQSQLFSDAIEPLNFIPASNSALELPYENSETIRINAGGKAYTDTLGQYWQGDKYFNPKNRKFSRELDISGTDDDQVFQTERYGKELAYRVPLSNDTYDIKLHFAEIYFNGADKRVFDVRVENNLIKDDLDLVSEIGKASAFTIDLEDIAIADGLLNIDLDASINNAKISGIEIVSTTTDEAVRINAGGSSYQDPQGQVWQADSYFNSDSRAFLSKAQIFNTEDDIPWQTERYGKNFSYDIPVDNGSYDVNLHFAEIYFDRTDKRIFDARVEEQLVSNDLDLVAEVGKNNTFTVGLTDVLVKDGVLNLDLIASINNAKISAIEIIPVEKNPAPIIDLNAADFGTGAAAIRNLTELNGTVKDDDLESYQVEIAPVSLLDLNNLTAPDLDYVEIASGNSNVIANTLAQIDPSYFEKDSYYLRVSAQDSANNTSFQGVFLEIDDPEGIYISLTGKSDNSGTKDSPLASFKDACKLRANSTHASGLDTIYVREGTYTNPGYDNGELNNRSMAAITCSGTEDEYLTIRPYGDEKVKFAFDSFNGIRLKGNYVNFQGFEVEGAAQDIKYEEALGDWWTGSKKYNGNGIVINGHHINVRDNIVHDTPGSAIFINNGGDHSNITDNIIYNAAWWSTKGTTAIGMINARNSDDTIEQTITAERNLVFGSESRIFSRVPSKGFAELAIDEGSGTLVQVNDQNYTGEYLIKDNFYLYNGKGIAIARTDKVTVENNTLYLNGSTINGKSTGLRLNGGKDINFLNNAVVVDAEDNAYSVAKENKESFVTSNNNYLVGGDKPTDLPQGNNQVTEIFTAPNSLDFSLLANIPKNVGAPLSVLNKLKAKADQYEITIAPTKWVMDYESQTKAIIESAPKGSTYDWSEWPEKVTVHLPEGQEFEGNQKFELRIKTPYVRED